ncbi:MAG: hypothetical protein Ct9H300mP15_30200 [Gemmatimonadota bacterium]|nr:MAG: hypothetical protein Ct9H300mP15_30200 [Gemmatimonadota bacterium]
MSVLYASSSVRFPDTFFGIYDMFVGGGLSRATILALGIMPYISASIMFQLLAAVFPTIEKLQKEGEEGRKKLTQWTRYTTVVLSAAQAYGYSAFLQAIPGRLLARAPYSHSRRLQPHSRCNFRKVARGADH